MEKERDHRPISFYCPSVYCTLKILWVVFLQVLPPAKRLWLAEGLEDD